MVETRRVTTEDFNDVPQIQTYQPHTIAVRTAREILDLPEPPESDMLLGPFVVKGFRTVIVGDTGHGKTTLSMQMASAILKGGICLDEQGAAAGPVLVIDLEQGTRSIKRLIRENNLGDRDDLLYAAVPDGLELDTNDKHKTELERVIVGYGPVMVILDPYYKAHRADSNEERAIVDLMRFLDEMRTAYGFNLTLPAHPRKPHPSQATGAARVLTLGDVFGSSAVTRGSEMVLAIERVNHGFARLRYLKDRDFDLPIGEFLSLTYSKDSGFAVHHKEEEDTARVVQQLLASDHEWRTAKEWATHLSVRPATIGPILRDLAETSRINYMVGPPGRSRSAKCYSTVPISREHPGTPGTPLPNISTVPTVPTVLKGTGEMGTPPTTNGTVPETVPDPWSGDLHDPAYLAYLDTLDTTTEEA